MNRQALLGVAGLALALAGCGSNKETLTISAEPPQSAHTTTETTPQTSTQTSAALSTTGPPAFTLHATSKAGDTATIQGWFGEITPATQAALSGEQQSCVQMSRASAVQLTMTATLNSSVPATVELTGMGSDGPGVVEIQEHGDHCDLQEISLGQLTPNQPHTTTLWLLLEETITPNTPNPSTRHLTENWRINIPRVVLNEDHLTQTTSTGPQVVLCTSEDSNNSEDQFIAISPEIPKRMKTRDTWGSPETRTCAAKQS